MHLGSALNEEELGALKAAARQRLVDGRGEFDLRLGVAAAGSPLEITASPAAISGAINDAVASLGISFSKLPIRIAAISDAIAAAKAPKAKVET